MAAKSKTKTKSAKRSTRAKRTAVAIVEKEREAVEEYVDHYDATDPRQALFLQLYYDRESPTWGNAKQSALAAGFSLNHANQITYRKPQWWLDFTRQQNLSALIEDHFAEVMNMPTVGQAMGAFGPIFKTEIIKVEKKYKNGKTRMVQQKVKVPVMVPNISLIKEKTAITKIAAPAHDPARYGRDKGPKVSFNFNFKADQQKYK